ncbi:MAG: thioredoxin domain-containing protein [Nannocystaceae bacterium]
MSRSAWSFAPLCALVLGLGAAGPGCIGKRRPQPDAKRDAPAAARLVQPSQVDGSLDAKIEGERMLAVYDEQDPSRGAAVPLVTIVEYSDFQCPYCGGMARSLDDLVVEYGRDVKLVFKQFPLPFHPQAEPAARAALAAHAQGRFWPMHDRLFANQKALLDGQLESYAAELGLDIERWRTDFGSDALTEHVAAEKAEATALGISGTPTFFINGKRYSGAMSVDQLRGLVDEELLAARALLEAGAKREELYARFLHPAVAAANAAADVAPKPAVPTDAAPTDAAPSEAEAAANAEIERLAVPTGSGRPQRGPADALVTLVEFSTYACDDCEALSATLDALVERHPQDVRLVKRSMARSGEDRRTAVVALAAHKQGKFWEAHAALLEHEGDFTAESAAEFATGLGLNEEAFSTDLRSREDDGAPRMLRDDLAVLDALGRDDTAPLLFVNGRPAPAKPTLAQLEAMVAEEKATVEQFLAANPGTDKARLYDAMRRGWGSFDAIEAAAGNAAPTLQRRPQPEPG